MQKPLFKILTSSLLLLCSLNAFATSEGEAYLPGLYTHSAGGYYNYYQFSNVTDDPIDVEVTFYDYLGQTINEPQSHPVNGFIYLDKAMISSEPATGPSVTFTITGKGTTLVMLRNTNDTFGHGEVKWSSSTPGLTEGLLAHGFVTRQNGSLPYTWSIVVNGGMAF